MGEERKPINPPYLNFSIPSHHFQREIMINPAPLLPYCNSSEIQTGVPKKPPPTSLDGTLESYIGGNSPFQFLQVIFVSLVWAFDAQQTFINVFADAEPAWHCTGTDDASCSSASTPCGLPPWSWAWDLPSHASVISEWDLQCSAPAVVGLPASAYFMGCLSGGLLLGTLADSVLGRKNMLFLCCLAMSLSGALTAVSPSLWVYAALRFICGFGRATLCTSALVLLTEITGRRWRDRIIIIGFFFFTLGFLSLPAIAYVNRRSSWRVLYLWISVPSAFYSVLIYYLINESPRWLLVRGRRDEAIQTIKSIASTNGKVISSSFSELIGVEDHTGHVDVFSAMKILWERRWALQRLTAIMTTGFGIGMVYNGLALNVGNLETNLYLSVTFNALAELPASLVTFFLIGKLNRRCSMIMFTMASGVLNVLCVFVTAEAWRTAAEVVSFFSACTAFNVILIYSVELFPTCVRNSAISITRQAIVLGGVFAPMLVALGRKRSFLSFGVFGLVIGCCGLSSACLPETRGRTICDTMEEEEYKLMASSNN